MLHRGGGMMAPLATLEPHSSNTKAWLGPISIWIEFGDMSTNCGQDPKKVSKFQWYLSYASCDEMIIKRPV